MTTVSFTDGWSVRSLSTDIEQQVTLPHDAMITEPRSAEAPSRMHGAFFPGGRYLYRKSWSVTVGAGQQSRLLFEGVYGDTVVRLNGTELARNISPYREFEVDLTPALRDGENEVEVEVDNAQTPNSRWYSGSGIYRPVWLSTTGAVRFATDGVRVVTRSVGDPAVVEVATEVAGGEAGGLAVRVVLADASGTVARGEGAVGSLRLEVPSPRLWSADEPNLYSATVELLNGGAVLDSVTIAVGLRTIEVDATQGLRINGQRTLLRGACVHHDNGLLGAATFADAEHRRARILKASGFNAVRSSHNPLSRSFLDACDELGLYVMDENTDVWFQSKTPHDLASRFEDVWPDDARSMVAKDRNHASVIMYSLGNEIAELALPQGVDAAHRIHALVHDLDPTRPTTLAVNYLLALMATAGKSVFSENDKAADRKPSAVTSTMANVLMNKIGSIMGFVSRLPQADRATRGALAAVDVAGYNYAWSRYRGDSRRYPERVILGSESMPGDIARIWPLVESLPPAIGDFMWTGWDYLGEVGIGSWAYGEATKSIAKPFPHLIAGTGAIDITGVAGAPALLAQASWGLLDAPAIAVRPLDHAGEKVARTAWRSTDALPSWSWAGSDGKRAEIEVYSDAEQIELVLNGRSLGRRSVEHHVAKFTTVYEPGELTAVAYRDGVESSRSSLRSASRPSLRLRAEKLGSELAYVHVELADADGEVELLAQDDVTIEVTGPAVLAGFGSARPAPTHSFAETTQPTFYGRALAIVRRTGAGAVTLHATSVRHGSMELRVG